MTRLAPPLPEGLRSAYWKNRSAENEKAIGAFLAPDTIKTIYLHGHPDPETFFAYAANVLPACVTRPANSAWPVV